MWDLVNISAGVSLYETEEAEFQFDGCRSRNVFRRRGTTTEYTLQNGGGAFGATVPGAMAFDAVDHPAVFSHNYPGTLANTCLVFTSPSPGVYNFGPELNFREEDFPWEFETQIVATSNPCQWRVNLRLRIFGRVCSGVSLYSEVVSFTPGSDTEGYFSNAQYPFDRFAVPKQAVEGNFTNVDFTFSKVVDRWTGEPPEITFNSSDQTSSTTGSVFFLKRLFNGRVHSMGSGTLQIRLDA
jgi:hypothetical protein